MKFQPLLLLLSNKYENSCHHRASRGIGLATAEKFLAEGWQVIGTSRSGRSSIDHPNFKAIKYDQSTPQGVVAGSGAVLKTVKSIDVLVNNAGILLDWEDERIEMKKLKRTLDVNLLGLVDFTERLVPKINKGGHIINISSMAASLNEPLGAMMPAYKISKAALNMYTEGLAASLSGKITVSSLDPGWVKTDMGGEDADRDPSEPADDIYKLATKSRIKTGQFWLEGKVRPW